MAGSRSQPLPTSSSGPNIAQSLEWPLGSRIAYHSDNGGATLVNYRHMMVVGTVRDNSKLGSMIPDELGSSLEYTV